MIELNELLYLIAFYKVISYTSKYQPTIIPHFPFKPYTVYNEYDFLLGWKDFSIAYIPNNIPSYCRKSIYLKPFFNSGVIVKAIQVGNLGWSEEIELILPKNSL